MKHHSRHGQTNPSAGIVCKESDPTAGPWVYGASIRPEYDTMVCGSVIHKYVALVVGLGPEAVSPGRTTRGQPPSRPPMALSGAPGAAPSTRWPVGPSAEHLERLQVLIEPSLTVSAKSHFLDLERALGVSPGAELHNRRAES